MKKKDVSDFYTFIINTSWSKQKFREIMSEENNQLLLNPEIFVCDIDENLYINNTEYTEEMSDENWQFLENILK